LRAGATVTEALTDRELEVFEEIGRGRSTRQIAEAMHRSVKTIETHRANIKRKLGLTSGTELLRRSWAWAAEVSSSAE
jgi:DNA-binding NarL/FixJ family response regulator